MLSRTGKRNEELPRRTSGFLYLRDGSEVATHRLRGISGQDLALCLAFIFFSVSLANTFGGKELICLGLFFFASPPSLFNVFPTSQKFF